LYIVLLANEVHETALRNLIERLLTDLLGCQLRQPVPDIHILLLLEVLPLLTPFILLGCKDLLLALRHLQFSKLVIQIAHNSN
jgi:hypothetical protein